MRPWAHTRARATRFSQQRNVGHIVHGRLSAGLFHLLQENLAVADTAVILSQLTWHGSLVHKSRQKHASLNNNESNVAVDEVKQYRDGRKIGCLF
jgi:hypothetical protein